MCASHSARDQLVFIQADLWDLGDRPSVRTSGGGASVGLVVVVVS